MAEEDEASDKEEESGNVAEVMGNLTIDTAATEEDVSEQFEAALYMEVEEGGGVEGECGEGVDGNKRALGALEFLTQDVDPSGTTIVDARNCFNKLSRLVMLWTVRNRWPAGVRFVFDCYRHWA